MNRVKGPEIFPTGVDDDDGDEQHPEGPARIYALDPRSGTVEWYVELAGQVGALPAYADGVLFVERGGSGDAAVTLEAIDTDDRSSSWTIDIDTLFQVSTPVVVGDTVYAAAGDYVLAAAVEDGGEQWRVSMEEWATDQGYSLEEYYDAWWPTGPVVLDDRVYVWGMDEGWLVALELE